MPPCDDSLAGKEYLWPRPREADEQKAGHDRGEHQAAKDFDCRDGMAIERRRSHVAIAHGRERLDAEKECIGPGRALAIQPGLAR